MIGLSIMSGRLNRKNKMIKDLSDEEKSVIKQCLALCTKDDIFPNWEFDTLFGVSKPIFEDIASKWQDVNFEDESTNGIVVNSLTWLLIYPHGYDIEKKENISSEVLKSLLHKIGQS